MDNITFSQSPSKYRQTPSSFTFLYRCLFFYIFFSSLIFLLSEMLMLMPIYKWMLQNRSNYNGPFLRPVAQDKQILFSRYLRIAFLNGWAACMKLVTATERARVRRGKKDGRITEMVSLDKAKPNDKKRFKIKEAEWKWFHHFSSTVSRKKKEKR